MTAPERALSSAFGYGQTRRGKLASHAGGHRLDAAGHYQQIRELAPLGADVVDVGGATLYVGAGLKAAMRGEYAAVVGPIAAELGHKGTGRLAVCPTVVDERYPAWAWRVIDPDGRELGAGYVR